MKEWKKEEDELREGKWGIIYKDNKLTKFGARELDLE